MKLYQTIKTNLGIASLWTSISAMHVANVASETNKENLV
jgi:hypothetical protein